MFLEQLIHRRCSQRNQVYASAKTERFFERQSELLAGLQVAGEKQNEAGRLLNPAQTNAEVSRLHYRARLSAKLIG
jgi:predicted transcriptional regulator